MERMREPVQGVVNIVRFNWHFYLLAALAVGGALLLTRFVPAPYANLLRLGGWLAFVTTGLSLVISLYVYDLSGLYAFRWLPTGLATSGTDALNIHAGFDETSALLQSRYPGMRLCVFDFYDPVKRTEVSIRRARRAYPPYPNTRPIRTDALPVADASVDVIFLLFAAHEIRDDAERSAFFRELHRMLKPTGRVVVAEHLRDWANFLAYSIGFFHFLPRSDWHNTFRSAGLAVVGESKINPFVTRFVLGKS